MTASQSAAMLHVSGRQTSSEPAHPFFLGRHGEGQGRPCARDGIGTCARYVLCYARQSPTRPCDDLLNDRHRTVLSVCKACSKSLNAQRRCGRCAVQEDVSTPDRCLMAAVLLRSTSRWPLHCMPPMTRRPSQLLARRHVSEGRQHIACLAKPHYMLEQSCCPTCLELQ